ncbi:hypothetical protein [Jeotgalicoccus psychrophilus]|uniref:hypothetical protein n=1 Tax=Jeotgalicoccus psychrophilus TaxID=157228 RepID=UPI000478CF17|nr:hypothetical protein [Jeotgalicoccus psychrophilus]
MKKVTLRLDEQDYSLAKDRAEKMNISMNTYFIELLNKDIENNMFNDIETRMNRKIELLAEVMEEQTREYINNKKYLGAVLDLLMETLNVEVIEDE